jgi:cytoskeletal protein RodZ
MAKHNYSQYSSKKNNKTTERAPLAPADLTEVVDSEVKMELETVEPGAIREPIKPAKPKTVTGTVANCAKLNVRVAPVAGAEVVTIVESGTKLTIDVTKSTDEWFSVNVDNGTEGFNGYCMKKFVEASL